MLGVTSDGGCGEQSTIFRAGDHPFALAVECHAGYVTGVAFEGENSSWVGRSDVVEFYCVVACSGEEALVWTDAQAVDLRIRMRDGSRADARESLPESEGCGTCQYA